MNELTLSLLLLGLPGWGPWTDQYRVAEPPGCEGEFLVQRLQCELEQARCLDQAKNRLDLMLCVSTHDSCYVAADITCSSCLFGSDYEGSRQYRCFSECWSATQRCHQEALSPGLSRPVVSLRWGLCNAQHQACLDECPEDP